MSVSINDPQTGRQYSSCQEYWRDKYYVAIAEVYYLQGQTRKIQEFEKIKAENKQLHYDKILLESIADSLKANRSEQETQLNKLHLFINKFAALIIQREPLIYEHLNRKISLGKMESALQKIIAELRYYEAFAIKTTIDKTKVKTTVEENACNYFIYYTQDFHISDKQRYLNYQYEQKRISEATQKYKDKTMNHSLVKHSEILNNMYSHYSRLSAQAEEAKKIINQIKDNIDAKKTYINYSNCSLYALFNELMSKVSTLYPTSTTLTTINKNTSNTLSFSYSSFYSIIDGVKYDRLVSFVDKLYQNMVNQSEGYKTRLGRLSEKIQFIEEKNSSEQCYYQKERRQQVEAYASKINQLVPQILHDLGKQAASGTTALHVFTFELADIDSIMSSIKNRQPISIASHPLKQMERIKQYFKESIHSSSAYLKWDKSLLELQSISQMVSGYCESLKNRVNQLQSVLEQKRRSALLNEAQKQANTASDEVHQMNTQLIKDNQLLCANNKNLGSQLVDLHQQHSKQIQKKDEQIEELHSSIRTLENDLATAKKQTKIQVEALKQITDQKRNELEQEVNSLREKLQSDKKAFDQTLTKKEEELYEREKQLRKQTESLELGISQMEAQYQATIRDSNQSHALQMQHLQKQHSNMTELKNSQVLNLSNTLQSLTVSLQQVQTNRMQLTREKYQLELANQHLLGTNQHLLGTNQHLLGTNQHLSGQLERIKTDQQRSTRSNQEEKQQALSLMAAEYANRIKQLCNEQNNDQLKTLSDAYQRQTQSLRKLIHQKEQTLILVVQERNDLQLNSYQMSLKIEQLISQRKNEQEQRIKLQQSATFQMQKLIAKKSKTLQQLQQQEKELGETRLQLQRSQTEKQLINDQNMQLTANTHKLEVQFQDRVREIQHECDQKLQSHSEQTQKYQHQIHVLTQINTQLLQKQQAQMRQQYTMRQQLDQLGHSTKYYSEQLRQKQQQTQTLKQELSQLKDSCHQLETENIVRMNEIADLRQNIETQEQQKKQQLEQLANQQRQRTQQHIQLTSQITQLRQQLKIVQQKQIATAEREAKANQQLKQLQSQYQELTRQHEDITQKYIQAAEKYEELLGEQIGKSMDEVSKISEAVGNSFIDNADEEKIKQLQYLLKQKQQQFENNFARYRKQSEQEISALKQKNKQLENQNRIVMQKNELIEAETQSIAAQIGALQEEIKSLRDNEKYYRNTEQQLQAEINNLSTTVQLQKQEMQKLQPIIELQKQEIAKLKQQKIKNSSPHKSTPLPLIEDTLMVPYTKSLFNEDIFAHDQIHKTVLVSHIEKYIQSRIARTRLLHKHDPKNKLNFHQYIDEVPTLCVVIKTKNAIISGLYPGTLRDKEILDKGGLLVSVTNNNSYKMFAKKPGDANKTLFRGMIYDTFFAIFGNAEIRVKTGFKTVFSNFGVSNGYFNSQGDKINKFLNEGDKREVQFEYCQFYQVLFEQPIDLASFIPSA